jgi:N-methylhydantoinase A
VRHGVEVALERAGLSGGDISRFVHGTTLATNVLLERRGARTALAVTEGFGDILRLARESRVGALRYDLLFPAARPGHRTRIDVRSPRAHDCDRRRPRRSGASRDRSGRHCDRGATPRSGCHQLLALVHESRARASVRVRLPARASRRVRRDVERCVARDAGVRTHDDDHRVCVHRAR